MDFSNEYKVDRLFLLVGTNPLPNAVAGKLLVKDNGFITLVCSAHTREVAQKLKRRLETMTTATINLPEPVEESSPSSVMRAINDALQMGEPPISIGLNYTGGTKAMAVHSYRAIERFAKGKGLRAIFSYLDARSLSLVFDPADPLSGDKQGKEYVGTLVNLRLPDLMDLHGWNKYSSQSEAKLIEAAQILANTQHEREGAKAWQAWKRKFTDLCKERNGEKLQKRVEDARKAGGKRYHEWKDENELRKTRVGVSLDPCLKDCMEAILQISGQQGSPQLDLGKAAFSAKFAECRLFCDWIDGKWLESLVLKALSEITTSCSLHDVVMNLEAQRNAEKPFPKFELDVLTIRGYRLFAFSCSTDHQHSRLKLKLFEAYTRARQIGGDEARVALVCCDEHPEWLQEEIRQTVDPEGRVKVFGRRHLTRLKVEVQPWLTGQSTR